MRGLAERSWFAEDEPPPELFRADGELPDLDYRLLGIADGGGFMAASLVGGAARLAGSRGAPGARGALADLAEAFATELRALRERCRRLPVAGTVLTDPAAVVLGDRYTAVVGAAAVLGVWEHQDGTDPFLAAPAWAVLALSPLAERAGVPAPDPPEGIREEMQVLDEPLRRHRAGPGYDLDAVAHTP
ncbi:MULTISPECIES: hypothetical protein [unclassified Streptomyces]|uniref:hypothetical protein n=1 Tax=unclassified Streptomyces TaxID=2593676 RepID=UPI003319DBD3